jgi:hypothetical protein
MTDLDALRRLAIIGVALAILIAIVQIGVALVAFGGDFEAIVFRPEAILGRGADAALLWRWVMLADMFDSYLLLVPLALFLHRRLRDRRPWLADLGLTGALAYIFVGGAAAAILATAGSSLIEAYGAAAPADRLAIAALFGLLRDALYFGVWQTLDAITAGTWIFSVGWLLLVDRPVLGRLLVLVGISMWAFAKMTMLDIHSLAVVGAILIVVLVLWLGWVVIDRRRREQVERPTA